MLDWNEEGKNSVETWMESAIDSQNSFNEMNHEIMWDRFDRSDLLETKICIAIYGNVTFI